MSAVSKSGLSRIPTFGSRIPQLDPKLAVAEQPNREISARHIGNRVRVGDKEGILRFVGEVHFTKGLWCGIELNEAVGKNDGFVNGVRYFACPERRGLMAPLIKVSLIEGSRETASDNASGPYSMLFIDPRQGDLESDKTFNVKPVENKKRYSDTENSMLFITSRKGDLESDATFSVKAVENKKRYNDTENNKKEPSSIQSVVDKSCENLLKESTLEVKRRRTSNPKVTKLDGLVLRSFSENIEKPSSLPQLKFLSNSHSALGKVISSSPKGRRDTETFLNLRISDIKTDDDSLKNNRILNIKQESNANDDEYSKRDSLELDESLGILTPDEMCTFLNSSQTRSPSFDKSITEYFASNKKLEIDSPRDDSLGLLDEKLMNWTQHKPKSANLDIPHCKESKEELQSPNLTDYSLGIIDEHMLSNLTMKTDTTVNMELPLDLEKAVLTRMEQTPSPEELPLDPTPIVECDPKTEPSKSKTSNSIINSITSITSLDTGYQGDGEMSRPASRGPDNSPPTRRPVARTQSRRIEPMTDSDFFTESDADNHEENPLRGDRKAQVIDGTLYGVDPQAAADIYVNNRENMDSSGIFTDIESNTRHEDDFSNLVPDVSPSDSTKTISENSQNNVQQIIEKAKKKPEEKDVQKENPKKRNAPSPGISSPSSFSSPRHGKEENANSPKKYKMPKREVQSKIKAMLEPSADQNNDKKLVKKSAGRWDAVMSKISKNEQNKTNLKEVKSKVFNSVNVNTGVPQRKIATRNTVNQKNPNSKLIASSSSAVTSHVDKPENTKNSSLSPVQPQPKKFKRSTPKRTVLFERLTSEKLTHPDNKLDLQTLIPKSKLTKSLSTAEIYKDPPKLKEAKVVQSLRYPGDKLDSQTLIPKSTLTKSLSTTAIYKGTPKPKETVVVHRSPSSPPVTQKSPKTTALPLSPVSRRRIRNRPNSGPSPKTIAGSNLESSIHSSLSDVSAATLPPTNKKIGSAKKRADVVQVTQVLTANKLTPRSQQQTAAENKKNATLHSSPTTDSKVRRTIFPPKEKKATIKECTRGSVKGGRASPTVRPPAPVRAPVKQPPVAEALAVLVQHLVFNVQAYQVPTLRKQVEKFRIENEEIKLLCKKLEETLAFEKTQRVAVEEERLQCQKDIKQLLEKHRNEITEINQHYSGLKQRILTEQENSHQSLCKQHEEQLATLKTEFNKLQRTHEESLEILREENEAIREQIDEKNTEIEKSRYESKKLKEDYETKEAVLHEQNQKLKQQINKIEKDFEERAKDLAEENKKFREENDRLLSYGDEKGISIQEVQSLRVVLELKQNEVSELRRSLAEATQRADILVGAEEKARLLNARCEDLQLQLQRKQDLEKNLVQENLKLQESFKEETNQKRRLSQYNEELQWKLKQNKEVINKVLEQAEDTAFNRKMMSASFNERHNSSTKVNLERAMSFRERRSTLNSSDDKGRKSFTADFENGDEISPPTSPKVKVILEKSDSVSYVLEMDESPEVVASRIVRRSFRNSTPAKNTPTKSPSNKRPRIRTPLSQSASSGALVKNDMDRPRSANSRNGDSDNDSVFMWSTNVKYDEQQDESYESSSSSMKLEDHDHLDLDEDNDDDLRLPALPSELDRRNGVQPLPCPKHLAGEAMVSESNSEDESTSSSQL